MKDSTEQPTILVAGATGFLGSEICKQLRAKDKKVRGLIRATSNPDMVKQLINMGVELIEGDLKTKSSLEKVVQGISTIISTVSSSISHQEGDSIETVDEAGQTNLIDAAVNGGVKHYVYISFCHFDEPFPLQDAKRKVEKYLVASGLTYTILQPSYFMEIWLGPFVGFDFPHAKATVYGDGKKGISWIRIKDVAAFAVDCIDNPGAKNKFIELGGPEALSMLEVVKIFEEVQGKKFELQFVPESALIAQKSMSPDPLSASFAGLMLGVAGGSTIDTRELLALCPLELGSVRDYAKGVSE